MCQLSLTLRDRVQFNSPWTDTNRQPWEELLFNSPKYWSIRVSKIWDLHYNESSEKLNVHSVNDHWRTQRKCGFWMSTLTAKQTQVQVNWFPQPKMTRHENWMSTIGTITNTVNVGFWMSTLKPRDTQDQIYWLPQPAMNNSVQIVWPTVTESQQWSRRYRIS